MRLHETVNKQIYNDIHRIVDEEISSWVGMTKSQLNSYLADLTYKISKYLNSYLDGKYKDKKEKDLRIQIEEYDGNKYRALGRADEHEMHYIIELYCPIDRLIMNLDDITEDYDALSEFIYGNDVFRISALIHELEHIEQFIKRNATDRRPKGTHKINFKSLKVPPVHLDTPPGRYLLSLIYYSRHHEVDAFTTQIATEIVNKNPSYIVDDFIRKISTGNLHHLTDPHLPPHLFQIRKALKYGYDALAESHRTPKVEALLNKAYKNLLKKIYRKVIEIRS